MAVGVAQEHVIAEYGSAVCSGRLSSTDRCLGIVGTQRGGPRQQVVHAGVCRELTASRRRNVFQELDSRAVRGTQCGDSQTRTEDLIEVFLLDAKILGAAGDFKAERVAIECEAAVSVPHYDRGMI